MNGIAIGLAEGAAARAAIATGAVRSTLPNPTFWESLSSGFRSFLSGKGGALVKAGAQVGTAVALPAPGIYVLDRVTSDIQQNIEKVTGILGSGSLLIIGILVFLAIMFIMLVK